MNKRLRRGGKTTTKVRRSLDTHAKDLTNRFLVEGLSKYTVEGIQEARERIFGVVELLRETGMSPNILEFCKLTMNQLDTALNLETVRAELWQNLRDATKPLEDVSDGN